VHSKKEAFITEMATRAGAMKRMYGMPSISLMYAPTPKPSARR